MAGVWESGTEMQVTGKGKHVGPDVVCVLSGRVILTASTCVHGSPGVPRGNMGGASKACLSRLQKEYQRLGKEPVPNVVAEPK